MRIILASNSPRRRQLLKKITSDYCVIPSTVDEVVPEGATPEQVAAALALLKAQDVLKKEGGVVIGADTVVALDGQILGKPRDKEDAVRMLTALSGRTHQVITGVAVLSAQKTLVDAVVTEVTFGTFTPQLIDAYVATGSPFDKAGAYGIQDGALPVADVRGSYDNVVGFPTERVACMLKEVTHK